MRFEVLSSASKSSNGEFGESQNARVNENSLTENLVNGDFGTRRPRSLNNQSMGRAVQILTKRGRARLTPRTQKVQTDPFVREESWEWKPM